MAIVSTLLRSVKNVIGDRKQTNGTYSAGSGEVDTGLEICENLYLQGTASALGGAGSVPPLVNATFPRSGSAVPILSTIGGNWTAYGR